MSDAINGVRVETTLHAVNCLGRGLEQKSVDVAALVSSDRVVLRVVVDVKVYGWSGDTLPLVADLEVKGWLARILKRVASGYSASAIRLDASASNILEWLAAAEPMRPPSIEGYRKLHELVVRFHASSASITSEVCEDESRLGQLARDTALKAYLTLRACAEDPVLGRVRLYVGGRLHGEASLRIPEALLSNPSYDTLLKQARNVLALRCEVARQTLERLKEELERLEAELDRLMVALDELERVYGAGR